MITRVHLVAAAAALLAAPAGAVIVSGTITSGTAIAAGGSFVNLGGSPTFAVGPGNHASPNVFGIDEKQSYTLTNTLVTDLGGNILAGTTIRSHVIVFDPSFLLTAAGTITFNTPVLAIIRGGGRVANSHYLGAPSVSYSSPASFALEASDFVSFSGNSVSYSLSNFSASDTFRVITAAVPEPSSWAMMVGGFGLVGFAGRRRRSKMARVSA